MRFRLGIGSASVALVVALGVPGTTTATTGSHSHTVLLDACSTSGGAYGYGQNVLKVEMDERGTSGVIQLAARASEQAYSGGTWRTIKEWPWAATLFGDNAKNHSWVYGKTYDLTAHSSQRHRMMFRLRFGNGTAYPVAREKVVGRAC